MNKRVGLGTSAGAVAALAFVLRLAVPTANLNPGAVPDLHAGAKAPAVSEAPVSSALAEVSRQLDIEGPWLASQTFFHQDPNGIRCPKSSDSTGDAPIVGCANSPDFTHLSAVESCVNDSLCSKSLSRYFGVLNDNGYHPKIQYIIATVPDPLHTRLALSTDSAIETIEKAAFESHWEFAAQWLPWYDSSDLSERDPEKRRQQRAAVKEQEAQPGLLIFRHGPVAGGGADRRSTGFRFDGNVLFVFLVGETPTAGINGVGFRIARAYMRAIGDPAEVRIAGPSFSGSYYSLSQLIAADQRRACRERPERNAPAISYVVRTSSASSEDAAEAFRHTPNVNVQLQGTGESGIDHSRHFKAVLEELHVQPGQAAILAEDNTAFSRQFSGPRVQDTIVLRFPRDISHLRNVYKDVNQQEGAQTRPSSVDFSLKDSESGEDTVPSFSANQTPLAQNSVLEYIIAELRSSRIRLVELAATNVLDSVFLAEVLRRQCPDIRLLVDQPDLLFVKAAQAEPLAGLLALSSYPLFPGSRHWSLDQTGTEKPVHESSAAEGLYNAVGSLLLPLDQLSKLNDYVWDNRRQPQTWLLELGRQGFSPVRLLEDEDASWYHSNDALISKATFRLFPSAFSMLLTSGLAALSLALCFWLVRLHRDRFVLIGSPIAPDGDHIADAYRLMLLFFSLLILSVAQAILYIPLFVAGLPDTIGDGLFHALSVAGLIVPFGFALLLLRPIFAPPRLTMTRYLYVVLGITFALLIPSLWYISCTGREGHTGFFLAMRAAEMHIGSSPSLPILFLLAALFVFSVAHLMRFYFLIGQRPRMFTAAVDSFSHGRLRDCRRSFNRILAAPMQISSRKQAALAVLIALLIVVLDVLIGGHTKLSSLEGRPYDAITLLLLSLVLSAIALTTVQMRQCSMALHQMLTRLHVLPLVCHFAPVHDSKNAGPIWVRRFDLQSLSIPTKSIIVLHNLRVAVEQQSSLFPQLRLGDVSAWCKSYGDILGNLVAARKKNGTESPVAKAEPMDRIAIRKEFGRLRYLGASISHNLNASVVVREWQDSALPWSPPVITGETGKEDACTKATKQSQSEIAQTFVALQYSLFINYGVRQVQNLLLSVSLGYGLLVIALNTYAFEALHLINRVLLIGFTLLGFVIWRIMAQMERDPILSRLSGTNEGELSREFYLKIAAYGALPVLTILSSQFPAIGHFLTSWVEPSLEAFK